MSQQTSDTIFELKLYNTGDRNRFWRLFTVRRCHHHILDCLWVAPYQTPADVVTL